MTNEHDDIQIDVDLCDDNSEGRRVAVTVLLSEESWTVLIDSKRQHVGGACQSDQEINEAATRLLFSDMIEFEWLNGAEMQRILAGMVDNDLDDDVSF